MIFGFEEWETTGAPVVCVRHVLQVFGGGHGVLPSAIELARAIRRLLGGRAKLLRSGWEERGDPGHMAYLNLS